VNGTYTPGYDGADLTAPELAVGEGAKARGFEWRWLVSFPAMLGTMLVGASFVVVRAFNVDPDLWWHVKTGELILSTHKWATTDPYSYTSHGAPWMSCEWLGDVLLAAVYRLGGLRGLEALLVVLASAVMLALYGLATLRSGNSKAGFVAAAALLALANLSFSLRPQMLGYLFLILTLIALERFRQGKQRAVWLLPVLFLIWINTHGSWIIGVGVIAPLHRVRPRGFPDGEPGSAALVQVGAPPARDSSDAEPRGGLDHAIWGEAGDVSLHGSVHTAGQRGEHTGMASHAL
jgi:hypothetical protein